MVHVLSVALSYRAVLALNLLASVLPKIAPDRCARSLIFNFRALLPAQLRQLLAPFIPIAEGRDRVTAIPHQRIIAGMLIEESAAFLWGKAVATHGIVGAPVLQAQIAALLSLAAMVNVLALLQFCASFVILEEAVAGVMGMQL